MTTRPSFSSDHGDTLLRFVRHGATAANLAGLRCGGDIDPPLTDAGRRQAEEAAQRVATLLPMVGLIISSDLQRTRETAATIARALGGVRVVVIPQWAERHLGDWNLRPIASTQAALLGGQTPPGGESNAQFSRRIQGAAQRLAPLMAQRPLLVGSKGVARVLGECCGLPERVDLDNGALCNFDLSALLHGEPAWETS